MKRLAGAIVVGTLISMPAAADEQSPEAKAAKLCPQAVEACVAMYQEARPAKAVQALKTWSPGYPREAFQVGATGVTVIVVNVDAKGRVKAQVDQTSFSSLLDDTAMRAIGEWRFKPAEDDSGNPVGQTFLVKMNMPNAVPGTCAIFLKALDWFSANVPGRPQLNQPFFSILQNHVRAANSEEIAVLQGRYDLTVERCKASREMDFKAAFESTTPFAIGDVPR